MMTLRTVGLWGVGAAILAVAAQEAFSHGPRQIVRRNNNVVRLANPGTPGAPGNPGTPGNPGRPGTPGRGTPAVTGGGKTPAGATTGGSRGTPSTGARTGGQDSKDGQVYTGFVPGSDGSIAWNTTRPVKDRPIMLYLFNCELRGGDEFRFAQSFETQVLRNDALVKESRDFVCEKLCYDSPYFKDKVKGREMVHGFVEEMTKTLAKEAKEKDRKVATQVVFLDAKGEVIEKVVGFDKIRRLGHKGLRAAMKRAERENDKRMTATP